MEFNIKKIFMFLGVFLGLAIFMNLYSVEATECNVRIIMGGVDHYPLLKGDKRVFYISSKGADRVQYRVFLLNNLDQKIKELTDGYTKFMNSYEPYKIVLDGNFDVGIYKLKIWIRKENSTSKYDYEHISNLNCIEKNNGLPILDGNMNIQKDSFQVGDGIKIFGIEGSKNKKIQYKYKLHVYDIKENKWIVDSKEYRSNIVWVPKHEGKYILDLWVISDTSHNWEKVNKNLNAKVYDGWKIKEITVKRKPEINFVGFEHYPIFTNGNNKFYITSKYAEKVQYRAWLKNDNHAFDITNGYSYLVDSDEPFQVDMPRNLKEGTYKLWILVRKEKSYNVYDNYYVCNVNVIKSSKHNKFTNIENDMNIKKHTYSVGEKIIINGIEGLSDDKETNYKYKLHIYDIKSRKWYVDKGEYKNEVEWIPKKAGNYMLDLWVISTNSQHWYELKNDSSRLLYDAWKLQPIKVINNDDKHSNEDKDIHNSDDNITSSDKDKSDDTSSESKGNAQNNEDNTNNKGNKDDIGGKDSTGNKANTDNTENKDGTDIKDNIDNKNNEDNKDSKKDDEKTEYYTIVNNIQELYIAVEKGYELIINDSKSKVLYEKAQSIISEIIMPDMSDLEKEIAIHNYIIRNVKYDYENYLKGAVTKDSYNAYGALVDGTAVCQGYAESMKFLLNMVGIECKLVFGKTYEEHAWCLVKIDGNYYHVDITWDDSINDEDSVSYSYFNMSDDELVKDHTWDRSKYPEAISDKYQYMHHMCFAIIDNGWFYYSDELDGKKLYKIKIDGTNKVKLTNATSLYIDTDNDYVYYSNYSHGGYLFKVRKDGIGNIMLNEEWSKNIQVNGDWIYYIRGDGNECYKIRKNGAERQLVEKENN